MSVDYQKTVIALLNKTEGRDKLAKGLAAFTKIVATYTNVKEHADLGSKISEFRSILRLVGWINNIDKIMAMLLSNNLKSTMDYVLLIRILGDGMYCVLDNLQYLMKHGGVDAKKVALTVHRSFIGMFWGFLAACIIDVVELFRMDEGKLGAKYNAEWRARVLMLTRNTCDMLAALSGVKYIKSFELGVRPLGWLGVVSASISSYENWNKSITA